MVASGRRGHHRQLGCGHPRRDRRPRARGRRGKTREGIDHLSRQRQDGHGGADAARLESQTLDQRSRSSRGRVDSPRPCLSRHRLGSAEARSGGEGDLHGDDRDALHGGRAVGVAPLVQEEDPDRRSRRGPCRVPQGTPRTSQLDSDGPVDRQV